jgi:hypothetical protein
LKGGERLNKNQKVIFASVGVIMTLIVAVLMIRSPVQKQVAPEPTKQVVMTTPALQTSDKPKVLDDSHKKVTGVVDEATAAVKKEVPGLWTKVVQSWNWFMGFDAKHAIILIATMIFVVGIIVSGGGRNKKSQH